MRNHCYTYWFFILLKAEQTNSSIWLFQIAQNNNKQILHAIDKNFTSWSPQDDICTNSKNLDAIPDKNMYVKDCKCFHDSLMTQCCEILTLNQTCCFQRWGEHNTATRMVNLILDMMMHISFHDKNRGRVLCWTHGV